MQKEWWNNNRSAKGAGWLRVFKFWCSSMSAAAEQLDFYSLLCYNLWYGTLFYSVMCTPAIEVWVGEWGNIMQELQFIAVVFMIFVTSLATWGVSNTQPWVMYWLTNLNTAKFKYGPTEHCDVGRWMTNHSAKDTVDCSCVHDFRDLSSYLRCLLNLSITLFNQFEHDKIQILEWPSVAVRPRPAAMPG